MFKKLSLPIQVQNRTYKGTQFKCGNEEDGVFRGLHYHYADIENADELLAVLPERYRQNFCLSIVEINTNVPPHTDSGIKAAINFYIQTDGCTTRFFKSKTTAPRTHRIANQHEGGFIFNEEDLIEVGCFCAREDEAWLLDVTKPHAVKPLSDKVRIAAQLATADFTFDEVKKMLEDNHVL
jgi:hypothetical protein